MTIIYSKPQSGNFPAAVVLAAAVNDDGQHELGVRAANSLVTSMVAMTRQELLDLADAIQMRFA